MTKQCCGTCRYYDQVPEDDYGYCTWSDKHPTPSCMDNADWDMYPDGGHMCQAWQAKETANA